MWTRSELKAKAKANMSATYWKAVAASIVLSICVGGSSGSTGSNSSKAKESLDESGISSMDPGMLFAIIAIVLGAVAIALIIGIALKIFVFNPLGVGCQKYFISNTSDVADKPNDLRVLGYAFKNGYKNVVLVEFMKNLFIFLWSLLFVIPGIYKTYQYRMVSYILAENPDMPYKEALAASKNMMEGQKWNSFVLDLSFIGWGLLSALTCGILYVFYVGPYICYTEAELYIALKENA